MAAFSDAVTRLRAAAEPTRLRMLALLIQAELTVGEICQVLGQSQPRVSRHLRLLSEAGLVDRLREQAWVYYRVPAQGAGREATQRFLELIDSADATLRQDQARVQRVLAERSRRAATAQSADPMLSERIHALLMEALGRGPMEGLGRGPMEGLGRGPMEGLGRAPVGGSSGTPIEALLDVGTGSGHLLKLVAPHAKRAVGIDISSDALRMARANIHGAGLSHCELKRGDMYDLPFAAEQFDVITVGRLLARAESPLKAMQEIGRVLKPGGRLLVLDDFEALEAAGHLEQRRGNPISTLRKWFVATGLHFERAHPVDTEHGHLLIALGRRTLVASAAA
jgi:ArsR family transcriptional regulator